jgi:phage terminase large subunit-like protein
LTSIWPYFARSAQLLADERFTMVEFIQSSDPMAAACQAFFQACLEGSLTHNNDPVLTAHIEATAVDKTERGWKIRKLKSSEHIDACVAAVLAVARARTHTTTPTGAQIFWMEA